MSFDASFSKVNNDNKRLFTKKKLRDLLSFVVDNRGKTPPLDNDGDFELLEINAIVGSDKFPNYDVVSKRVSLEVFTNWFRKGHPQVGDVLFSTVGSIAEVVYVSESRGCIAQNLVALRPCDKQLNGEYLYYVLSDPRTKRQIVSLDISSVQPSIKLPHLLDFELEIPSLSIQSEAVRVLSALDNKIEVNRRINQTLEAMAQAIFESWFVDFDPVRAKIAALEEGEDPLRAAMCAISGKTDAELEGMSSEDFEQLAATAALFPDAMEDSELGEIPRGWECVEANRLIEFNPKEPLSKGTIAPYLDMASLPTAGSWAGPFIWREYGSGMRFRNGDTLLARITPCLENGKSAFVQCLPESTLGWGSTEFIVMRAKSSIPPEYAYLLARDNAFREHAIRSMTGTSGRQRAQVDSIAGFKVVAPLDDRVWEVFSGLISASFKAVKVNSEAMERLSELRDVLLPELLSGELLGVNVDEYEEIEEC